MIEREHGAGRDEPGRDEAMAVEMPSPTAAADDETYRRLMALGRGVQADFDEALAELAGALRRLTPRPDRGLTVDEAIRRTMRKHRNVLAALAESEWRDRETKTGHASVRRCLAG